MNKFSARKTPCQQGHKHASAKESKRCNDLHLLQRAGKIAGLEIEPKFTFVIAGSEVRMANGRSASFKPDFAYIEKGTKVVEDVKGGSATRTEAFALRWALAKHLWPTIEWRLV